MFVNLSMYKILLILLFAYGLAVTTEDIYDNSYALIIGIDKYENVRSLDYAVKDAEDIQSMLVDKFHFQQDNIVLLKDEEATKTSILQEFSNITKKAEANDRVLIFFAGHGETEDLPDGGEMGYLLPVDGNNTDLYISSIKMDEIQTISLRSEAKHILYLIDACYGGIATVGARSLDTESTPNYLNKITQYKSRQIISAGGRGEEVIEKSEWGHSAFTKNILSGLRDSKADADSDGIITAQELGIYLKKKVTIDSDNQQTPKTRNLTTDEGEFIFLIDEKNKNSNNKIDEPLIDNIDNNKNISKQNKLASSYYFSIGAVSNQFGIKSNIGFYLDKGKSEVGITNAFAEATNYNIELIQPVGIYYRKYFIPFGRVFIDFGLDMTFFHVNILKDKKPNLGFKPYIGLGTVSGKIFNRPTYMNFDIGYLFVSNSIIPETTLEDVPHGIQFDMTYGIHRRKLSTSSTLLPE